MAGKSSASPGRGSGKVEADGMGQEWTLLAPPFLGGSSRSRGKLLSPRLQVVLCNQPEGDGVSGRKEERSWVEF